MVKKYVSLQGKTTQINTSVYLMIHFIIIYV